MLKKIGIFPHPPVVLPEIGREDAREVDETYKAMESLGQEFASEGIKKVIVISPHGFAPSRMHAVNTTTTLKGNLGQFNYTKEFNFRNDTQMVKKLVENGFYGIESELDHGVLVPLYFLEKVISDLEVVSISSGFTNIKDLEEKGKVIANLLNRDEHFNKDNFGLVISADLSHRLKEDSHYGFAEEGPIFDRMVYEAIEEGRLYKIKDIPEYIVEGAGQCGFIPLILASFVLGEFKIKTKVLSYEKPFGVGYLVGKGDIYYD